MGLVHLIHLGILILLMLLILKKHSMNKYFITLFFVGFYFISKSSPPNDFYFSVNTTFENDLSEKRDSSTLIIIHNGKFLKSVKLVLMGIIKVSLDQDSLLTFIFLSKERYLPITIEDYPNTKKVGFSYPIYLMPKELKGQQVKKYYGFLKSSKKVVKKQNKLKFFDGLRIPVFPFTEYLKTW